MARETYSFQKGGYHLLTDLDAGGVKSGIGLEADWNELMRATSPLQQLIESGDTLIPSIYTSGGTEVPLASHLESGKLFMPRKGIGSHFRPFAPYTQYAKAWYTFSGWSGTDTNDQTNVPGAGGSTSGVSSNYDGTDADIRARGYNGGALASASLIRQNSTSDGPQRRHEFMYACWIFKLTGPMDGVTTRLFNIGVVNDGLALGEAWGTGYHWMQFRSNGTTWEFKTCDGATASADDTGIGIAVDTLYVAEMGFNMDGNAWWSLNSASGTKTTNLPGSSTDLDLHISFDFYNGSTLGVRAEALKVAHSFSGMWW